MLPLDLTILVYVLLTAKAFGYPFSKIHSVLLPVAAVVQNFEETQNFDPVFDGSFVPLMLERFAKLAPFYHFLCTLRDRAKIGQGGRA